MYIKTNLKTNEDYSVLRSVIGQLSDGIFENSPMVEKYWQGCNIERAEDGEVLINCNFYIFSDPTEKGIKQWFANKIKQIVKCEIDNGASFRWDKGDKSILTYMHDYCHIYNDPERKDPTVADAYGVYKALLK